jgi:hypothetical protein
MRWAVPFTLSHCFSVDSQPVNGPGGSVAAPWQPGLPGGKKRPSGPLRLSLRAFRTGREPPSLAASPCRDIPVAPPALVNAPAFFKPGHNTLIASVCFFKSYQHTVAFLINSGRRLKAVTLRPENRRSVHGRQGQPDRDVWLRACGTRTCRHARPVRRTGKAQNCREQF